MAMDLSFLSNLFSQNPSANVGAMPQQIVQPQAQIAPNYTPGVNATQPPVSAQPPVGNWLSRTLDDPAMNQAVLMAGLKMLEGTKPGQSQLQTISQGMQTGVGTYVTQQDRLRAQKMQDQEFDQNNKLKTAQIAKAENDASPENIKMQNDARQVELEQNQMSLDLAKRTIDAQVETKNILLQNAKTKQEKDTIELNFAKKVQDIQLKNPKLLEDSVYGPMIAASMEDEKASADIKMRNAQTQNQYSNMAVDKARINEINASTNQRQAETDAYNALTPEEKKSTVLRTSGGGNVSSKEQDVQAYMQAWDANNLSMKPTNPKDKIRMDAYNKARGAEEMRYRSSAKTNTISGLNNLINAYGVDSEEGRIAAEQLKELLKGTAKGGVETAPAQGTGGLTWDPKTGKFQ
jgi:hypothetical protein